MAFFLLASDLPNHVSNLDRVMTTVVPKLSKTDSVPFKALKPSGAEENSSASFARALKEADSSRAAVRQASEAADNSVRLRSQNGESETSAGASEIGDDLNPSGIGSVSLAGRRVANSGDLESAAKNPGELTEALAGDPANIAGIAAPLASPSAILTATDANVSIDGTLSTQVATVLAPGAMSKAASGELSDPAACADNTPVSASSSVPTSAAVLSTSR